ncbi:MAG: NnrS family protein [Myxococcales bacterium]|nr:NnrS family protein [Myxococcales bacterium]
MMTTLQARMEPQSGLAILRSGHRLLFLGAAVYGAVSLVGWLLAFAGHLPLRASWHGHELIFGFAGAAIGGFLTAAVPKWTRSGLFSGWSAGGLFALWLVGRIAMWTGVLTWLDLLFVPVLAVMIWRRLWRARNQRNYQVAALLGALLGLNIAWHGGLESESLRSATMLIVALIALIGGRIVPAFTRNAMAKAGLPTDGIVHHALADKLAVPSLVGVAALELFAPFHVVTGALELVVAGLLAFRGLRWGLVGALRWPIVWVMHAAWWFVPTGLALAGAVTVAAWFDVGLGIDPFAALHALTAGAIGGMIMAVASRAARGHAGMPLVASRLTVSCYALVLGGALLRVVGGPSVILVAGSAWALGWLLFGAEHAPMLVRARRDGRPG